MLLCLRPTLNLLWEIMLSGIVKKYIMIKIANAIQVSVSTQAINNPAITNKGITIFLGSLLPLKENVGGVVLVSILKMSPLSMHDLSPSFRKMPESVAIAGPPWIESGDRVLVPAMIKLPYSFEITYTPTYTLPDQSQRTETKTKSVLAPAARDVWMSTP